LRTTTSYWAAMLPSRNAYFFMIVASPSNET
jgi:hypothetical protein